ncbi:MAG: hypothetical protein AAFN77_17390 [Planctomycetota bacterium]
MNRDASRQVAKRIHRTLGLACLSIFCTALTFLNDPIIAEEPGLEHPVSIVNADVYVNRNRTTMKLTCFAEDLELLQGVEALPSGLYDPEELIDATKDHGEYLAERITIRDINGELLTPKIVETIDIEIPEEGIPAGKLMDFTIGFVLEYSYKDAPEPKFLTIEQKMVAEGQLLPSEFKVLLKQAGSDTPYTKMMKPSEPETFSFDWDSPVLNKDDSPEQWEAWFAEQRKKNLGIESYSSVYSFIYITDYEVRNEVLIPLATLATLIDIERADENFLEIEEQDAAAEKIKTYFSVGNPVTIDGVEVAPVFDRVDFYGLDLRDFAIQAERRRVSMANGRVGLIMSYSTKGRPAAVEVSWDKFNNAIKSVDGIVFIGDKVEKTQFSMFLSDNTYSWTAPERKPLPEITGVSHSLDLSRFEQRTIQLPVVSLIAAAACAIMFLIAVFGIFPKVSGVMAAIALVVGVVGINKTVEIDHPWETKQSFEMPQQDADLIFAQLHKNLFRAFDYRDESDVYDALARSVDGEELRSLYLRINESLKVKEQGGAVARIDQVELLDGELNRLLDDGDVNDAIGFGYRSSWILDGTIEHWGHIHKRETKFVGEFRVRLIDDAWKITDMQVVNEEAGVVKTAVRTF